MSSRERALRESAECISGGQGSERDRDQDQPGSGQSVGIEPTREERADDEQGSHARVQDERPCLPTQEPIPEPAHAAMLGPRSAPRVSRKDPLGGEFR